MVVWDPKETLESVGLGRSENKRAFRVADVIRNEIAILLVSKVRDPKLENVFISKVTISDDLKYTKIYYTMLGGPKEKKNAESGLQRAKGFFRSHLAKTLNLRHTPELRFIYDETAEKVEEMEKLFQEIADDRMKTEQEGLGDDT